MVNLISGIAEIVDMLFLHNHLNLFIPSVFMVQIGMAFTLSNRFSVMYMQLENTVEERNQLLAQIKTMLSRTAVVPKSMAKGSLSLDIISGRAFLDNNDLTLAQKEFAVLLLLMQNEDKAISVDFLYESVWKAPLGDNISAVISAIYRLRKKIKNSGYQIAVSRGKGYIFERI